MVHTEGHYYLWSKYNSWELQMLITEQDASLLSVLESLRSQRQLIQRYSCCCSACTAIGFVSGIVFSLLVGLVILELNMRCRPATGYSGRRN